MFSIKRITPHNVIEFNLGFFIYFTSQYHVFDINVLRSAPDNNLGYKRTVKKIYLSNPRQETERRIPILHGTFVCRRQTKSRKE